MTLPESTNKLQRTFIREEVYHTLQDWIVTGKLEPGEHLRDKELAEILGVSRTPIREALLRLEDEGLVQTKPNRWTQVAPINLEEARNIYPIVWSLERLALTTAFDRTSNQDIEKMELANHCLKQAMAAGDHMAALKSDNDFHSVYINLANNDELNKLLSGLKVKLRRIELYYFDRMKDAGVSCAEHDQIINSLKQRDLKGALDAIESNWKNSLARIQLQAI
ncbi:GntR family transcriptional regulator [Collibacillus ludicampi]|uniref:GntR family transcriptional regulator n=1 Tax=Collibacillus ludicampi TaxID=2771369 RepID=A0AAV4L9L2_9BACL|nr:GntR family transcriptional regulator [Collibacillus ludicampi]GIM44489.1 GntR family transcriptional regulator [Collibacillus ludicampi]